MSRILGYLAFAALPLLAGCGFEGIYSEQPLGEALAVLKPAEWDGVWLQDGRWSWSKGGLSKWRVTDEQKGTIARRRGERLCDPLADEEPLHLRRFGSWYFYRSREGPDSDGLYQTDHAWLRFSNAVLTYKVDKKQVRALVEEGVIPGRIDSGRVILGPLTPVHYRLLLDPPAFSWEPLSVETRLPAELDPCRRPGPAN